MTSSGSKIFGIGLSKTGTTSLANALQMLGYRTKDNMGLSRFVAGDVSSIDIPIIDAYDAITDTPIPSFYRQLDARYPRSKFILTVREHEGWLKSCMKQFTPRFAEGQNQGQKDLFVDLYGTNVFDPERFASGYDRYVRGVHDYFRERPADLLVLDVTAGEGWEKLCPFLGRPIPDVPFPKANVTKVRWMNIEDVAAVAESAGDELMRRYDAASEAKALGSGIAKQALRAAMGVIRGRADPRAAAAAAQKAMVDGLTRLNSQIPVLSRRGQQVSYEERKHWNHFWLVDPLDGEGAFKNRTGDFSVNIALIEDGRPIYGVVHAPAKSVTYYGRAGKGAFRMLRGGVPTPISSTGDSAQPGARSLVPVGGRDGANADDGGSSCALAMCRATSPAPDVPRVFGRTMEWHTAAPQAILAAAGMHLQEPGSGNDLRYNKELLATALLVVV